MEDIKTITVIKPFTTRELAGIYDVCEKTFKKWLKPHTESIGEKHGRYYTVVQVKTIIEKLGLPCKVNHAC